MAVLDKPGVVLVTRNVYVAVTVVLLMVAALLVTVGAIPVTTTVYMRCVKGWLGNLSCSVV